MFGKTPGGDHETTDHLYCSGPAALVGICSGSASGADGPDDCREHYRERDLVHAVQRDRDGADSQEQRGYPVAAIQRDRDSYRSVGARGGLLVARYDRGQGYRDEGDDRSGRQRGRSRGSVGEGYLRRHQDGTRSGRCSGRRFSSRHRDPLHAGARGFGHLHLLHLRAPPRVRRSDDDRGAICGQAGGLLRLDEHRRASQQVLPPGDSR
jgi:hypothetical protein